jgi:hypothetical protein
MLQHRFVEYIPETLKEGVLYISMEYCTAIHTCVCGCGNKVVTPISPTDWQLKFDGRSVSLKPSIGNWSFDCQSHYWITNNKIEWAGKWDKEEIEEGRRADHIRKHVYFDRKETKNNALPEAKGKVAVEPKNTRWMSFLKALGIK